VACTAVDCAGDGQVLPAQIFGPREWMLPPGTGTQEEHTMSQALVGDYVELQSGVLFLEPPAPADSDEEIQEVVRILRTVTGAHSLQAALEVGDIVFRHVFRGDERLLRVRGRKCSSFRKLAADPSLGMSPSSLWRAVAIFELGRRFPEIAQYVHTGVGHISVVLGLPPAEQFRLLRQTEAERWTRRKLQKITTEIRVQQRGVGALPNSKLIERLEGLDMLMQDAGTSKPSAVVDELEMRTALSLIDRIRSRVAEVEGRLTRTLAS
jgi:hypothetical protein